jgi:putative transposase
VHLFLPRHSARIQFLLAQIRILRARLESERIVPTPEEKAELLRWGALFEHDIQDVLEIVKPATYRRWLSQTRRGKPFKRSGRPRITEEIRQLVLRMAKENALWGYRRIAGELKKLDYTLGPSSVKRILRDFGIFPAPKKARKQPPLGKLNDHGFALGFPSQLRVGAEQPHRRVISGFGRLEGQLLTGPGEDNGKGPVCPLLSLHL